eukprot:gene8986-9946_t
MARRMTEYPVSFIQPGKSTPKCQLENDKFDNFNIGNQAVHAASVSACAIRCAIIR